MRKIHPGFIAIAILGGPAAVILGHQAYSERFSQAPTHESDAIRMVQHIYQECAQVPKVQRTRQCAELVTWIDHCRAAKDGCGLRSAYPRLIDLQFAPPPKETSPV